MHGEILELVYQHCPEVCLVKPRNRGEPEKALRVPEKIVVVELIGVLARTLYFLCKRAYRPISTLPDGCPNFGVGEWVSLDIAQ